MTGQIQRRMTCSECGHHFTPKQLILEGFDRRTQPRQAPECIVVIAIILVVAIVRLLMLIGVI